MKSSAVDKALQPDQDMPLSLLFVQESRHQVLAAEWHVLVQVSTALRPLLLLLFGLTACVNTATLSCTAGEQRNINEMLFFGRDMLGGEVSADEWQQFVDEVITPRFPQGLSVWPVYGQWKMADGTIIQENSFALNVLHDNNAASNMFIEEIMSSYKSRFQQEAVLRVKSSACVSY